MYNYLHTIHTHCNQVLYSISPTSVSTFWGMCKGTVGRLRQNVLELIVRESS